MSNSVNSGCSCEHLAETKSLVTVEEAQAIAVHLVPLASTTRLVALEQALGQVNARDLRAPREMPFFDNSAMDGFAVKTGLFNGEGPWEFLVGKTIPAGSAPLEAANSIPDNVVPPIMTGAPMPAGFDAVVPQEHSATKGNRVQFSLEPSIGMHVREKGSDMLRGALLLEKGRRIAARHIGLLAANGYSAVNVYEVPKVAVLSTGDELLPAGKLPGPGQIHDSNKPMLIAQLAELGIKATDLGSLPDKYQATVNFLKQCRNQFDLILSSGSVSVGERDYLKSAFEAAGGVVSNWKAAVKPGKPVMFGKIGDTVFTGLPGNPFACFVGFDLFAKLQVDRLCGLTVGEHQSCEGVAAFDWKRKTGRAEIIPVMECGKDLSGLPKLKRLGNSVSATLYPLASASGLARVASDCDTIRCGDRMVWNRFCTRY